MKEKGKAEGKGNWCVISTPDNLFKLGIDVNFKELGYQPLFINCDDLIVESSSEGEA